MSSGSRKGSSSISLHADGLRSKRPKIQRQIRAESVMSFELGDSEPLAGVGAAPPEFCMIYKNAPMRAVVDETSFCLSGGPASQVRPEIRITDRRLRHDHAI